MKHYFAFVQFLSDVAKSFSEKQNVLTSLGWLATDSKLKINGVRILLRSGLYNSRGVFIPGQFRLFLTHQFNLSSDRPTKISLEDAIGFSFVQITWIEKIGKYQLANSHGSDGDPNCILSEDLGHLIIRAIEWLLKMDNKNDSVATADIQALLELAQEFKFPEKIVEIQDMEKPETVSFQYPAVFAKSRFEQDVLHDNDLFQQRLNERGWDSDDPYAGDENIY